MTHLWYNHRRRQLYSIQYDNLSYHDGIAKLPCLRVVEKGQKLQAILIFNLKFIEIIPLHKSDGLSQYTIYLLPLLPPETEPPSSFRLLRRRRRDHHHPLPVTPNIKIMPLLLFRCTLSVLDVIVMIRTVNAVGPSLYTDILSQLWWYPAKQRKRS